MMNQEWLKEWKDLLWEKKWDLQRQQRRGTAYCRSLGEEVGKSSELFPTWAEGGGSIPLQGSGVSLWPSCFQLRFPSWGDAQLWLLCTQGRTGRSRMSEKQKFPIYNVTVVLEETQCWRATRTIYWPYRHRLGKMFHSRYFPLSCSLPWS